MQIHACSSKCVELRGQLLAFNFCLPLCFEGRVSLVSGALCSQGGWSTLWVILPSAHCMHSKSAGITDVCSQLLFLLHFTFNLPEIKLWSSGIHDKYIYLLSHHPALDWHGNMSG